MADLVAAFGHALDGVCHVLGNFVAANFGIRIVRFGAGSCLKARNGEVTA